jgi:TP901 family phage tail tape measure protein
MPASVRDILLVIRTKEDASRSINNIAGAMRRAHALQEAVSRRAQATQLRAQAMQARAQAAAIRDQSIIARTNGATMAQIRAMQLRARQYDHYATQLQGQARHHDRAATAIETERRRSQDLNAALRGVGRTAQMTGVTMIAAGGAMAFGMKQAVDVAAAWDRQVRLTFTQVDKRFKPSLRELSDIGIRVAKDIAVPFEEIQVALFDIFSSTEANLPEAEQLLRSFSQAAVAGQTDITTAARATIGIMNAFKVPMKDVNKILDIQFQLVQEGVGTYEEWSQRIGLVTPSAVRAGQSVETMAAALATVTRMGISSARAGTAVSRAFDAISNPKTEKALKGLGVATRDARGEFRPLVDIMTEWKAALDKMPKADRVKSILDTLKGAGSTIEARRFLQGILLTQGGLELFQDQIKEFATDKGAFQNAYNEMADSVSAKTELLRNAWMTLKLTLGQALMPTFLAIVGVLQRVFDAFNKLPEPVKRTIAMVTIFGTGFMIAAGIITVLVGSLVGFIAVVVAAGSAMLPVVGVLAGVAAVTGLVIAAFTAFAGLMLLAWQRSENFRALMNTIWLTMQAGVAIIVGWAQKWWSMFSTYILPPMRQLGQVINNDVIPAIQGFVAWGRAHLLPIIQAAGNIILNYLKPAFAVAASVIRDDVVPAIAKLTEWWNKNKATLLPLIKIVAMVVAGMIVFAGVIVGTVVIALALGVKAFLGLARVLMATVQNAINVVIITFRNIVAVIKIVINWFKNLGKGAGDGMNTAKAAVQAGIGAIKGFFSGAGSWLLSAGRNIVSGLINGIRGMVGQAASAAANLAATVKNSAMAALGIRSPSTVFKDIGANVVRGFVLGIQGNRKKIQDTMFALTRDIRRSISAADISANAKRKMRDKWNKRLSSTETKLLGLESKRAKLQTQLAAATASYNKQLKYREDLSKKISDALASATDITSLTDDQKKSSATMVKGLQERLTALRQFQADLLTLSQRGFDRPTIAQLASQGVEAAGGIVHTLATANQNDLNQITMIQEEIRKISGTMGDTVAGQLYDAGIKAAAGLMKGLSSQIAAITKQMTAIANALVAQIKKELGIKSPSRVMMAIGVDTAKGFVNGYLAQMEANKILMAQATAVQPMAPAVAGHNAYQGIPVIGSSGQLEYGKQVQVNQKIYTQEIDPRKHAAELGWELAGRM